jgi:hypothetical protein
MVVGTIGVLVVQATCLGRVVVWHTVLDISTNVKSATELKNRM